MRLRCFIALSLPALAVCGSALADRLPTHVAIDSVVQTAILAEQVAHLASLAVAPTAEPVVAAEAKVPAPTELGLATPPAVLAPDDPGAAKSRQEKHADKAAKRRRDKAAEGGKVKADKAMCVQAVGKPETGNAAWYGGRYIGRRTTSGSRLDTIHPTAAHRTLPLNSLARVTNLDNGRSVVVRVTDRGPVSNSLLIDMSPKAADELHMKHAGVVPVKVEQVVEVPPDPK